MEPYGRVMVAVPGAVMDTSSRVPGTSPMSQSAGSYQLSAVAEPTHRTGSAVTSTPCRLNAAAAVSVVNRVLVCRRGRETSAKVPVWPA